MSEPVTPSHENELDQARQLQTWVRRSVQNRTLPVAVFLGVFALLFLAIALPSYWGGVAYRSGNVPVAVVCLAVLIVALAATLYLSVPRWSGGFMRHVAQKLYATEGTATVAPRQTKRSAKQHIAIAIVFVCCVFGTVILGCFGYLPGDKYMQPITAIYVVPFLLAQYWLMRPVTGPIVLLWPALYALHAILILAGAPIVFDPPWNSLNILLPIVGYGLVTSLAGHFYSRWALHKAQAMATRKADGTRYTAGGSGG